MSDHVTNNNYIEDTKVSVSINKTNANKCTLYSGYRALVVDLNER